MYYINLFQDTNGALHYSCEEFAVGEDRITSLQEALGNAVHLQACYGWNYHGTLTLSSQDTSRIENYLAVLASENWHGCTGEDMMARLQEP